MSSTTEQLLLGTLATANTALDERRASAQALTEAALERIERLDAGLHAFITVDQEGARRAARHADERTARGARLGPLDGIPVAVKDNIATAGLRTTFNSRTHERSCPTEDHPAVAALRAAGAVIVGKTNLNELGWSVPAASDLTPPPRNPWRTSDEAVGSSSGSAVAVAAGMCLAALGTDGGGSIRLPASQMSLVGLKPTQGQAPFADGRADSVSVVGVLTRDSADASLAYAALRGEQELAPKPGLRSWRVAVPRRQLEEGTVEDEVLAAFDEDLGRLSDHGVEVLEVDLPLLPAARDANFLLVAAQTHARFGGLLRVDYDRIGVSARRYLLSGAVVGVEAYLNARQLAARFGRELDRALGEAACVALATPVSPVVTTAAARRPGVHNRGGNALFTSPFNANGWPAISVPTHVGAHGIPLGLQFAAPPGKEHRLLRLAGLLEVPLLAVTVATDMGAPS